jgi:hypothetical protein
VPSNSSIATLDKQIAKATKELGSLDGRVERARATIANVGIVREELEERISYLSKIRARKLAATGEPVAAVDGETPVLNTELEPELVEETVALEGDPRLTSAV